MGFEGSNCSFRCIGLMYIWWDELVGGLPYIGDGVLVAFAGFIVQDLMFYSVAFFC